MLAGKTEGEFFGNIAQSIFIARGRVVVQRVKMEGREIQA